MRSCENGRDIQSQHTMLLFTSNNLHLIYIIWQIICHLILTSCWIVLCISRHKKAKYLQCFCLYVLGFELSADISVPWRFYQLTKLYIPSTLNIDLILWHTQLIVCAVNVKSWFKSWVFPFTFQAYILPHTLNCICVSL